MTKSVINTTLNFSPNFDREKRSPKDIKFLIFHYTGMKKEIDAINRLIDENSKVSCHYFIKNSGEILTLVPDLYISWHAGTSSWLGYKSINQYSIGVEISNPGHENKYKNFSNKQINAIEKLSKYLIKKYNIKSEYILGHSDIAPERKKDPGEKFPWKYLSSRKIGYWHGLNVNQISRERNIEVNKFENKIFFENLYKFGYSKNLDKKNLKYLKKLTIAFQRRFRQELINGKVDRECFIISKKLKKKN